MYELTTQKLTVNVRERSHRGPTRVQYSKVCAPGIKICQLSSRAPNSQHSSSASLGFDEVVQGLLIICFYEVNASYSELSTSSVGASLSVDEVASATANPPSPARTPRYHLTR